MLERRLPIEARGRLGSSIFEEDEHSPVFIVDMENQILKGITMGQMTSLLPNSKRIFLVSKSVTRPLDHGFGGSY